MAAETTNPPRTLTAAEEMRLAAGFIVQPFVAGVVAFVGFPLLLFGRDVGFDPDPARGAISVALGTFLFAIGVTLVVAVPAAIRVVKRRAVTFRRALLYGLAIGNLPVAIGGVLSGIQRILLSSSVPANPSAAVGTVLFASLVGAAGAPLANAAPLCLLFTPLAWTMSAFQVSSSRQQYWLAELEASLLYAAGMSSVFVTEASR